MGEQGTAVFLDSYVEAGRGRGGEVWGRREWEGEGRKAEEGGLAEAFDVPNAK